MQDITKKVINIMASERGYSKVEVYGLKGRCLEYGLLRNTEEFSEVMLFLKKNQLHDKEIYSIAFKELKEKYNNISISYILIDNLINQEEVVNYFEEIQESLALSFYFVIIDLEKKVMIRSHDKLLNNISDLNYCLSNINFNEQKKEIPYITYILMAINIVLFIPAAYLSGNIFSFSNEALIFLGAKENTLIQNGQYYRLFTCMFLHGGIVHIISNMYSLYAIGPFIEEIYGKYKYLFIYILSGIAASIFSYLFSPAVSIGASGAIFGLLGAMLVFALKNRKRINKKFLSNIISVIFINLIIGATLPGIDNFAHLGGLIGGVILSAIVSNKEVNK